MTVSLFFRFVEISRQCTVRARREARKNNKRAITFFEVMALWVELFVAAARLHHPIHVGRLMPTLLRRRLRPRPRNMSK